MPWSEIIKILSNLIKDPTQLAEVVLFALLAIWWFREVKGGLSSYRTETWTRLDKTLEIYGELEMKMLIHLRKRRSETEEEVFHAISKSYPYLSPRLLEQATKYSRFPNFDVLEYCVGIIQEEVPKLREKYKGKVPELHDSYEYSMSYISIMKKAFLPVAIVLASILYGLAVYLYLVFAIHEKTALGQIAVAINFLMIFYFLGVAYAIYGDKEIMKKKNFMAKLTPLLFLLVYVSHFWWYKVAIVCGLFIFVMYLSKRKKKLPPVDLPRGRYM